jgi:hypothetical protein
MDSWDLWCQVVAEVVVVVGRIGYVGVMEAGGAEGCG